MESPEFSACFVTSILNLFLLLLASICSVLNFFKKRKRRAGEIGVFILHRICCNMNLVLFLENRYLILAMDVGKHPGHGCLST